MRSHPPPRQWWTACPCPPRFRWSSCAQAVGGTLARKASQRHNPSRGPGAGSTTDHSSMLKPSPRWGQAHNRVLVVHVSEHLGQLGVKEAREAAVANLGGAEREALDVVHCSQAVAHRDRGGERASNTKTWRKHAAQGSGCTATGVGRLHTKRGRGVPTGLPDSRPRRVCRSIAASCATAPPSEWPVTYSVS